MPSGSNIERVPAAHPSRAQLTGQGGLRESAAFRFNKKLAVPRSRFLRISLLLPRVRAPYYLPLIPEHRRRPAASHSRRSEIAIHRKKACQFWNLPVRIASIIKMMWCPWVLPRTLCHARPLLRLFSMLLSKRRLQTPALTF